MTEYKLSKSTHNLAQIYKKEVLFEHPKNSTKIQVDSIVSKLAALYEKLRYAVDYREEHALRRHAIERTLKRMLLFQQHRAEDTTLGLALIRELIRAGYFPNNTLPEYKAEQLDYIIEKYQLLAAHLHAHTTRELRSIHKWLLALASVEIEGLLVPHQALRQLLEQYFQYCKTNLVIQKLSPPERECDIQLFLACHRALLNSDPATISYDLFVLHVPEWEHATEKDIIQCAHHVSDIKAIIERHLVGPLAQQLGAIIHKPAVLFSILGDVLHANAHSADSLLFDVKTLTERITTVCNERYRRARKKLRRSAINSIVYIFCTKIILAFIVEVPYDILFFGAIHYPPLIANIVFHPLLMFLITTSTRVPSEKNTHAIVEGILDIVYKRNNEALILRFKKSAQPGSTSYTTVNIMYGILFLITFGIVFSVLSQFGFTGVSSILFVFFLTIITFIGIRIRRTARELVIINNKENIFSFLFDILSLPLLRVGRWISIKSSKVNIFVFILDYLLENPFKSIVQAIEAGILYIRQKKDELYH